MLALWSTTIFIFQFVIGLFGPTVFQLKRVLFSSCINAEHVGRKEGKGYLITHKSHEWAPLDCSHEWEKSDWKVLPCCCFDALIVCLFVCLVCNPGKEQLSFPERQSKSFLPLYFFALLHSRTYLRTLQCFPICNVWLESGTISLFWYLKFKVQLLVLQSTISTRLIQNGKQIFFQQDITIRQQQCCKNIMGGFSTIR